MLRLTPTLFMFELRLPGTGQWVEVVAEVLRARRGERDEWGRLLEPDDPGGFILHTISGTGGKTPAREWAAWEPWLEAEAKRRYEAEERKLGH